jgi:lycopene beta-cyclase
MTAPARIAAVPRVVTAGRPARALATTDLVIAGAGCAGLSLAAHVAVRAPHRRVVVIDPRTTFGRDRTWCYWDVHEHLFAEAATHRWAQWRVAGRGADVVCTSARYAYHHVPADAFYRAALARLARAPNVELALGERVTRVVDTGAAVVVETCRRRLRATALFDSRPPAAVANAHAAEPGAVRLVQHFAGAFVRADRPVFEPGTATLMDFAADAGPAVDGAAEIAFTYVLPFDAREALVESTVIAAGAPAPGEHERRISGFLARRWPGVAFTTVATEGGAIPMATPAVPRRPSPRVYRIGIAGGLAKPSTGYAFLAIQRDASELARRLARDELPLPPAPRGRRATFLDRVFLSYLRRRPREAAELFAHLFARTDPDALVRFLSDTGSLADQVRVASALPFLPFAAEAVRSHRTWRAPA